MRDALTRRRALGHSREFSSKGSLGRLPKSWKVFQSVFNCLFATVRLCLLATPQSLLHSQPPAALRVVDMVHRGEQTYHFDFFADDVEGCWRTRPHASHSARSRGIGLGSCSRVRFRSFASLWELWRFRRRMVRSCIFFEVFGRGCPCFCSNRQLVCVQETYPYASITSRLPDVP